ncbi:transcriptional regulator PtsJ [Rhodanobacter denitrificans]|uniref:MocR-like B6 salvage transcription factor PtsJ n=1 Tax=Rhodanobacter denitrificans TaxID=666685 RepID=UPI001F365E3C|nr:transcriptional regulator PtsJ [Rhodanobacter denitrificans]UJJ60228.1 transcriptional regulator PtsJ [Rhodanobacter denitrificans]
MKIRGKTATELFDCIRAMAQSQLLSPGQTLPPVRDLAAELGVNRNTVAAAYRRLITGGIAKAQGRLGTIIRDQYAIGEQEGRKTGTSLVDLASGNPNPAWLPDITAALKIKPYRPRLYGDPTVNAALEAYARHWFTPDCPGDFEIDVSHGAVDAIERLLDAYLVAGDKVAVENPCFLSSINTLRTMGLHAIGVPVDAEGMQAKALETALNKGARAVIITPRAHNPTGCSLSAPRAKAIARVLARHPQVPVIVDDHFALLSNAEYCSAIPANTKRWALVRSLTKALGPDIRMALVSSDASTSRQLRLRLASGANWVSHVLQDMAEVTLTRPEATRQIGQARDDYARRRQLLVDALHAQGVPCSASGDGLNLWLPLSGDDQMVVLDLARRGWLVRQGSVFSVQETVSGLRITTAHVEPGQCPQLARDVKQSMGN